MLTLNQGEYRLEISDAPPTFDDAADDLPRHDATHVLGDSSCITSRHALRLFRLDRLIRSCLLCAEGGVSGVHDRTAVIHGLDAIVAVGPYMVSLAIPSLALNWASRTDEATCFGVFLAERRDCLLSHGEMLIARVMLDGTIAWQAGGADIFTNGFQLDGDLVRVIDFNDREYTFDIETGRELNAS